MIIIVAGPHNGFWLKDNDKVIMWCYSRELAEKRLAEMQNGGKV